jgi:hypothetical protein
MLQEVFFGLTRSNTLKTRIIKVQTYPHYQRSFSGDSTFNKNFNSIEIKYLGDME